MCPSFKHVFLGAVDYVIQKARILSLLRLPRFISCTEELFGGSSALLLATLARQVFYGPDPILAVIYIMQNTMVGGGVKWPAGEKNEIRSKGKKIKKGKEKRRKITLKMGKRP